ncbi:hypothetical protein WMF38_13600 [Sorangium sp. So ce118]
MKSLRWAERVKDALDRSASVAARHPEHAGSMNDEMAKFLWLAGDRDRAREVLHSNVAIHGRGRETRRFAERCERWAGDIVGEGVFVMRM